MARQLFQHLEADNTLTVDPRNLYEFYKERQDVTHSITKITKIKDEILDVNRQHNYASIAGAAGRIAGSIMSIAGISTSLHDIGTPVFIMGFVLAAVGSIVSVSSSISRGAMTKALQKKAIAIQNLEKNSECNFPLHNQHTYSFNVLERYFSNVMSRSESDSPGYDHGMIRYLVENVSQSQRPELRKLMSLIGLAVMLSISPLMLVVVSRIGFRNFPKGLSKNIHVSLLVLNAASLLFEVVGLTNVFVDTEKGSHTNESNDLTKTLINMKELNRELEHEMRSVIH